ncbi:MAG TPA: class I SAM-dependent methyltransferase [Xanthomonadales bacterium]|nr:class I SAM-dependent methyltransferase [Xanthomonadales bacterium]
MTEKLDFDGERFTPENVREIWYEHMHRYAFAAPMVAGLDVLDAACGEGYGAAMLSATAHSVKGVDVASKAIEHAKCRYDLPNLDYQQADCCNLPFEDHAFDCIVSFETIEHLEGQSKMLSEFRRVLKPTGFLLISSPDKAVYSEQQGFDNPFHVRELYRHEFETLLESEFPVCRFFGQKLLFHSAIWPMSEGGKETSGTRMNAHLQTHSDEGPVENARPVHEAMYLLAVCAQDKQALPELEPAIWMFDDQQESVYKHYQHEIRKNMQAGAILAERDAQLLQLKQELAESSGPEESQRSWLERLGIIRRR